jgi:solute carrier family 35 protein E1
MDTSRSHTALLGGYYLIWCVFGVMANVYAKVFLSDGGDAVALTLWEFTAASAVVAIMSAVTHNTTKSFPALLRDSMRDDGEGGRYWMVMAVVTNGLGHLLINSSMAAVNVSLTHTIRAAEPLCVLLWDWLLLHHPPQLLPSLSLLPIFLGVYLVCRADLSFTLPGFSLAMLSNFLFSLRNVSFKAIPKRPTHPLLFYGILCFFGSWLMVLFFLFEWAVSGVWPSSFTPPPSLLLLPSPLSSSIAIVSHFVYNTASFGILSSLSTVTHAVGNAMRRVTIVVAAIFFFHSTLSLDVFFGIVISTLGCIWYSLSSMQKTPEIVRSETIKV